MKNRLIITLTLVAIIIFNAFSQKIYFWSNHEKHFLEADSNTLLVSYRNLDDFSKAKNVCETNFGEYLLSEKSISKGKTLIIKRLDMNLKSLLAEDVNEEKAGVPYRFGIGHLYYCI